jgi:hypothetical protein
LRPTGLVKTTRCTVDTPANHRPPQRRRNNAACQRKCDARTQAAMRRGWERCWLDRKKSPSEHLATRANAQEPAFGGRRERHTSIEACTRGSCLATSHHPPRTQQSCGITNASFSFPFHGTTGGGCGRLQPTRGGQCAMGRARYPGQRVVPLTPGSSLGLVDLID